MLRPSFIPPIEIRQLRDYTRLRIDLTHDRTRQKERIEKLLEDALIKLSSVAADIYGVSGRAMMEALITGERDPKALAPWKGRTRVRRAEPLRAVTRRLCEHQAELLPRADRPGQAVSTPTSSASWARQQRRPGPTPSWENATDVSLSARASSRHWLPWPAPSWSSSGTRLRIRLPVSAISVPTSTSGAAEPPFPAGGRGPGRQSVDTRSGPG